MTLRTLLAAAALIGASSPAIAQHITGPARAIDGDSLEMTGSAIRLFGIDAPEAKQTCQRGDTTWACGDEAVQALQSAVADAPLSCIVQGRDAYGLMVSTCTVHGNDIALELVQAGLATALPNADPAYHDAEARARARRTGIWGGTFQTPAEWRAAHPREDRNLAVPRRAAPQRQSASAPSRVWRSGGRCLIKGNESRRQGETIYYLPGMKYYAETQAEAMFCTEDEAMAAGYRRSRGG